MRVIDASSLAKFVNREPNWKKVEEYLLEGCISVDLCIKEVLNTVWKRIYRGLIDKEDGFRIANEFLKNIMIRLIDQEPFLESALKLSVKYGITVYDALYIALAKKLELQLITSDEKQFKVSVAEGIDTIYIE